MALSPRKTVASAFAVELISSQKLPTYKPLMYVQVPTTVFCNVYTLLIIYLARYLSIVPNVQQKPPATHLPE
jgi:hypothetical protein